MLLKSILPVLTASLFLNGPASAAAKRAVPAGDVGTKMEIIGNLGVPVGKVVTITGQKKRNGPGNGGTFWVTSVDGRKAETFIDVEGIENWPEGTEATLKGAEVGRLSYVTVAGANFAQNDPRWKGPYQRLSLEFKVDKVVSPAKLRLGKDEVPK